MDKYIEKIRMLKKENMKLKKYKIFVEKNKDTKLIYNEIKNLQNEENKYKILQKDFIFLQEENKLLSKQVLELKNSELSFANKNKFYKQQIQINSLEEDIKILNNEKNQIYEDHKDTFEKNKDMEIVINRLKNIFDDVIL